MSNQKKHMKEYEYKKVDVRDLRVKDSEIEPGTRPDRFILGLNKLGKEGWKLVSITDDGRGFAVDFYFEREKEIIQSTCWEYIQGLREKPCCSACPACNCHKKLFKLKKI